jgi:DNA replication protein DnaC
MSGVEDAVIQGYLRSLRLPGIGGEYPSLIREAQREGWSFEVFLRELLESELRSREMRTASRRLKEARFPETKTLDQIDWDALQGVSGPLIQQLSTCAFIERAEDVILCGPIGTCKSHLAVALGVEAARRGFRVLFTRAADLVQELVETRDSRQLGRLQRRLLRTSLLIVDELGFVPFDREGGELLFNLLSQRYEKRSTVVTTNLAFSEWVQVFGNEKLTTALLDRLGHHAHIITTKGPSYRTRRRERSGEG